MYKGQILLGFLDYVRKDGSRLWEIWPKSAVDVGVGVCMYQRSNVRKV